MPSNGQPVRSAPGFVEPAPFEVLKRHVQGLKSLSRAEMRATLTAASFAAISSVDFDEAWYLSAYPDIKLGVESEQFESGLHHYQIQGYFEGRLPKEIEVDEDFYLENNPDVKRAITMGVIPGAELHFLTKGYKEGRIPSASYSFSRPELSEALRGVKARVSRELSDVQPVFAKQA